MFDKNEMNYLIEQAEIDLETGWDDDNAFQIAEAAFLTRCSYCSLRNVYPHQPQARVNQEVSRQTVRPKRFRSCGHA
jgi:hypothetical protein